MFIRISEPDARKRLLAFLREHHYLAVEENDGLSAYPLNPVSDRYDRLALLSVINDWETSEKGTS